MDRLHCELVSIITPAFNAARFLPRVAESVAAQTAVFEHIIIDDCSTDSTAYVLKELSDKYPHIRIVRLNRNSGPVVARNAGIAVARGRYLAFLDADDLWLPAKLEIQIKFMKDKNCSLSFTDYRFISVDGTLVGSVVKGPNVVNRWKHFATRSGMGCLTVVLDRLRFPDFKFLETKPLTARAEDFWAWAELLKAESALRVPHDLARYTVVPGSRSYNFLYKAKVVWEIYRQVEKMHWIVALYLYSSFAISAAIKRFRSRPQYPIEVVDDVLGRKWIDLVRISE